MGQGDHITDDKIETPDETLDPKHTAGSGTGRDPGLRAANHSCLRTAWPLRVSTLKLLVLAGMMKKATTVCSLPFTWSRGKGGGGRGVRRPPTFHPLDH